MKEKCMICSKILNTESIYLCENHTFELNRSLKNESIVISEPSEREHCQICGEYEDRRIINYMNWFYACNICIEYAYDAYMNKDNKK